MTTLGKYELLDTLGSGGMGTVYRARDPVLEREVAIKVISTVGGPAEVKERFYREGRACAQLQHPHIVAVYDLGEQEDEAYIVMELLIGADLKRIIAERRPMALEAKITVMLQVLEGLGHAHRNGIVHRDIKPGNIFLHQGNCAKILDFGIARIPFSKLTLAGAALGTPEYMAPEQIAGQVCDARSDLFSAAMVFYQFLSYVHPFPGPNAAGRIVIEQPEPLREADPELPDWLEAVIGKGLEKTAAKRHQTAEEFAAALEAGAGGVSRLQPVAPPAPFAVPGPGAQPDRPDAALAAAAAVGAAAQSAAGADPHFRTSTRKTGPLPFALPRNAGLNAAGAAQKRSDAGASPAGNRPANDRSVAGPPRGSPLAGGLSASGRSAGMRPPGAGVPLGGSSPAGDRPVGAAAIGSAPGGGLPGGALSASVPRAGDTPGCILPANVLPVGKTSVSSQPGSDRPVGAAPGGAPPARSPQDAVPPGAGLPVAGRPSSTPPSVSPVGPRARAPQAAGAPTVEPPRSRLFARSAQGGEPSEARQEGAGAPSGAGSQGELVQGQAPHPPPAALPSTATNSAAKASAGVPPAPAHDLPQRPPATHPVRARPATWVPLRAFFPTDGLSTAQRWTLASVGMFVLIVVALIGRSIRTGSRVLPAAGAADVVVAKSSLVAAPRSGAKEIVSLKRGDRLNILRLPAYKDQQWIEAQYGSAGKAYPPGFVRLAELGEWSSDHPERALYLLQLFGPSDSAPDAEIQMQLGRLDAFVSRFGSTPEGPAANFERARLSLLLARRGQQAGRPAEEWRHHLDAATVDLAMASAGADLGAQVDSARQELQALKEKE